MVDSKVLPVKSDSWKEKAVVRSDHKTSGSEHKIDSPPRNWSEMSRDGSHRGRHSQIKRYSSCLFHSLIVFLSNYNEKAVPKWYMQHLKYNITMHQIYHVNCIQLYNCIKKFSFFYRQLHQETLP